MSGTLQTYMQEVADAALPFAMLTTTALGTTTTLICSDLASTALFTSTSLEQMYLYFVDGNNAGSQRVIESGSLDTSTGTVTFTPAVTNAVASGVNFWLVGRVPVVRHVMFEGLREFVNKALRNLWTTYRVPLTGVTNQYIYPLWLTSYPWMTRERVIDIYAPNADATVPLRVERSSWRYKSDGESQAIEFLSGAPYKDDDAFYVEVSIPANARMQISGSWTNSTSENAGLVGISDVAMASVGDVTTVALAHLYRSLAKWGDAAEAEEWRALQRTYAKASKRLLSFRPSGGDREGIASLKPTLMRVPTRRSVGGWR